MSLTEKTIRSAAWQLVTILLLAFVQIITTALVARYLLPAEFGLMSIATIVYGFVTVFSEVGIGSSIIRSKSIDHVVLKTGFMISMLTSAFVFLAVWFLAPVLAHFFNSDDASYVIRLVSLSFLISGWSIVSQALMERQMEFKRLMFIKTIALVVSSIVSIGMAIMGYGVWALVSSLLTNSFMKTVLVFALKPHPIGFNINKRIFLDFFNYSLGLTISRAFQYGAQQGDNIIVGRWMGTETLGFYSKAFQLMILPVTYLGQTIDKVTYPGLSLIKDNKKKLNEVHLNAITLVNVVMIPFGAVAILTAREIVLLLLGSNWTSVIFPLQILLVTVSFRTSVRMVDSLIRAIGAVYRGASRNFAMLVMIAIGCSIAKEWGISGIAIAVSISYLINYLMMTQLALKLIEGSWMQIVRSLLPGIYMATLVSAAVYPTVIGLRSIDASAILVLFIALVVSAMCFLISYRYFPRLLGEAGAWIRANVVTLYGKLRSKGG